MQSWSIGFLCYNEEQAIVKLLDKAYLIAPMLSDDFEIVVVDDGSSDNSLKLLYDYKKDKQPNLKIIIHEKNKGIGEALISAYEFASKENIIVTCGDGQFDLNQLLPFKEIEVGSVVCFYRLNNTTYSLQRNYLSAINRYFNKYILGIEIKDVNWSKIFKKTELKKIKFEVRSSLIETEICAKLKINGNRFIEVESKYLDRIGGVSKGASFNIVFKAVRDLLKLFYVVLKFKFKNES